MAYQRSQSGIYRLELFLMLSRRPLMTAPVLAPVLVNTVHIIKMRKSFTVLATRFILLNRCLSFVTVPFVSSLTVTGTRLGFYLAGCRCQGHHVTDGGRIRVRAPGTECASRGGLGSPFCQPPITCITHHDSLMRQAPTRIAPPPNIFVCASSNIFIP